MERAGLSQQEFAQRLNISPASLSSIYTGRTNPTGNHVKAIHMAFPEINVNWLMFGEGEMVCTPAEATSEADATMSDPAAPAVQLVDDGLGALSASAAQGLAASHHAATAQPAHAPKPASARPASVGYGANPQLGAPMSGYGNCAINIDKRTRKIKEIRVFFDDGTYEAFVPSSK